MFKRRFRLPSPALVIAMVTLGLVLGGTAVAASTTKHGDKKADIKLIKKLAPTLSVKHAKTANSATEATHAASADSATNATNAANATNATHATSADSATNAANLGGHPASAFVGTCGNGSLAAVVNWYAPAVPADPTYVAPNRFGGEGGFACNGGTPQITREGTGWFRIKIVPALPSTSDYLLFANPDSRGSTPLYVQANSEFAGPVWDVHTYDKNGNPTDPYYLEVMLAELS